MEEIIEKYRSMYASVSSQMMGELRMNAGVELSEIRFTGTRGADGVWHVVVEVTERQK